MKRLTDTEIDALRSEYPYLDRDYFDHLARIGWGPQENGRMLYSGPVHPADVYGDRLDDSKLVLLGDDGCGYCFAFDPVSSSFGELTDRGEWTPWGDRSFVDYVS
ncbi:hypothetical protein SH528x_002130 [Novipirellula sp. SH528]|uniref:hypothetical protein n=1 Tax=Novipirellula sp. SH528 TaxID=3454466 RepID=UPI003FA033F6